jgi:hypothetical protein
MSRTGWTWTVAVLLALFVFSAFMLNRPLGMPRVADAAVAPVASTPRSVAAAGNTIPRVEPIVQPTAEPEPEPEADPTAAPEAEPTVEAGPTAIPLPTPRPADEPWRIGLQIGHLRSNELPDELARLRTSTGARYGNVSETQLNESIVLRVAPILEANGIVVDILPATVPPSYAADAFLAIHADGNASSRPRGWKLATPWRASPASKALYAAVHSTYGAATGLPEDRNGITSNMRGYYAFNYRRYEHAIAPTTPAIIVEIGYMTNAADREVLFNQPDRVAQGIADGILRYLAERDRNNVAALIPPDFPNMLANAGALLRTGPSENAGVRATLKDGDRLFVFDQRDGYYELFVRGSRGRLIGWVREDQVRVQPTAPSDPPPEIPGDSNP